MNYLMLFTAISHMYLLLVTFCRVLVTTATLDREMVNSYNISIRASDGQQVSISVCMHEVSVDVCIGKCMLVYRRAWFEKCLFIYLRISYFSLPRNVQ